YGLERAHGRYHAGSQGEAQDGPRRRGEGAEPERRDERYGGHHPGPGETQRREIDPGATERLDRRLDQGRQRALAMVIRSRDDEAQLFLSIVEKNLDSRSLDPEDQPLAELWMQNEAAFRVPRRQDEGNERAVRLGFDVGPGGLRGRGFAPRRGLVVGGSAGAGSALLCALHRHGDLRPSSATGGGEAPSSGDPAEPRRPAAQAPRGPEPPTEHLVSARHRENDRERVVRHVIARFAEVDGSGELHLEHPAPGRIAVVALRPG